jgi:hypothetical protein
LFESIIPTVKDPNDFAPKCIKKALEYSSNEVKCFVQENTECLNGEFFLRSDVQQRDLGVKVRM